MKVRAALAAVALVVVAALGGCASSAVPGRAPDVTATVSGPVGDDPAGEPSLTGASDDYFEGMALRLADAVVVDVDGRPVDAPGEGDRVEVWIGDACAESYPVQCDVVALRVLG